MYRINVILYLLIIVCDIIGLCTTISLSIIIFLRRSTIQTDSVSYLLIANTYIPFIVASPIFIEMSLNSVYGNLYPNITFDGWICSFKSYFLYINGCVYFFSFFLQSIYRYCRIVHPTRAVFRSFRLYLILSIGQWILAAILLLPSFFLGDFKYLPEEYHCQLSPTDLRGSLLGLSFLFTIPFVLTLICYLYTMDHVRTRTVALITINRYRSVRRDLIILSRLVVLFSFTTTAALPHAIIPIVYTITGYLPFWVVPFEWLLTLFSLAAGCTIQIFVTTHLKKLCL